MALVNAQNAKLKAKKAEKIAQQPPTPTYIYKPKKFNLLQRFIRAFTGPHEGEPNYGLSYGPTLEEQYAKQAAKQAKLEKRNREWYENVYPDIVKEIQARSKANPPALD